MSLCLRDGDYVSDGCGGFRRCVGAEDILERVLFKLQAQRGGFDLLPTLGSRLYRLPKEKSARREALAKQYVEEALQDEPDLRVEAVEWQENRLTVHLRWQGERLPLLGLTLNMGGFHEND